MTLAKGVATRADCRRRKVGAVVLDRTHRVAATGYNGAAPGVTGCLDGGCPRGLSDVPAYSDYDNCIACHAEVNALLYSDRSKVEGGTLYITDEPCTGCRKVIANSGVLRVVWPEGDYYARSEQ
jgi:dCMP deaminase